MEETNNPYTSCEEYGHNMFRYESNKDEQKWVCLDCGVQFDIDEEDNG